MSKKLLLGAIASIITINSVLADTQTITTQNYVDTRVETKQDKISPRGTGGQFNLSMPTAVITDTDTDGVIAKRYIIQGGTNGWTGPTSEAWGTKLADGYMVQQMADDAELFHGLGESDIKNSIVSAEVLDRAFKLSNSRISAKQKNKICVRYLDGAAETSENCLLWNLPD